MSFTDEDLRWVKNGLSTTNYRKNIPPLGIGLEKMNALLARLEAAEECKDCLILLLEWVRTARTMLVELGEKMGYTSKNTRERIKESIQISEEKLGIWRKAAGK